MRQSPRNASRGGRLLSVPRHVTVGPDPIRNGHARVFGARGPRRTTIPIAWNLEPGLAVRALGDVPVNLRVQGNVQHPGGIVGSERPDPRAGNPRVMVIAPKPLPRL